MARRLATKRKSIHVLPRTAQWVIRREGSVRPASVFETKRDAVQIARQIAQAQSAELIIHNRDGRISERNSYGRESMPPVEPRVVLFPAIPRGKRKKAIREAVYEAIEKAKE